MDFVDYSSGGVMPRKPDQAIEHGRQNPRHDDLTRRGYKRSLEEKKQGRDWSDIQGLVAEQEELNVHQRKVTFFAPRNERPRVDHLGRSIPRDS